MSRPALSTRGQLSSPSLCIQIKPRGVPENRLSQQSIRRRETWYSYLNKNLLRVYWDWSAHNLSVVGDVWAQLYSQISISEKSFESLSSMMSSCIFSKCEDAKQTHKYRTKILADVWQPWDDLNNRDHNKIRHKYKKFLIVIHPVWQIVELEIILHHCLSRPELVMDQHLMISTHVSVDFLAGETITYIIS